MIKVRHRLKNRNVCVSAAAFSFLSQKRAKGKVICWWDFLFLTLLSLSSFFSTITKDVHDVITIKTTEEVCMCVLLRNWIEEIFCCWSWRREVGFLFYSYLAFCFDPDTGNTLKAVKMLEPLVTHWTQVEIRVSNPVERECTVVVLTSDSKKKKRKPEGINERQMLLCHVCVFLEEHQESKLFNHLLLRFKRH